jgi:hypothetical protein
LKNDRRRGLVAGATPPRRRSMLAFVSFAATLDLFGESKEVCCVLHACVSYVFNGTLARKKTIRGELAIIIRVRHDTPHSLNITTAVSVDRRRSWLLDVAHCNPVKNPPGWSRNGNSASIEGRVPRSAAEDEALVDHASPGVDLAANLSRPNHLQ